MGMKVRLKQWCKKWPKELEVMTQVRLDLILREIPRSQE